MPKRKTIWIAELTRENREFLTKKEATQAEEEDKLNLKITELSKVFRKYFKTYHESNSHPGRYPRYLFLCVDCGKKVLEYECRWDGHRNEIGDIIFQGDGVVTLLDGKRCKECNEKIEKLLEKMLLFHSQETKIIHIFSLDKWKSFYNKKIDKETLLHILEVVDYYDKNYKKSRQ